MTEPLPEGAFDFLDNDPKAKRLVTDMLAAVVDHPDVHVNSFEATRSGSGFKYFLGLRSGQKGAVFQNNQWLEHNIIPLLVNRGIAEQSREPNTPKNRSGFTEAAKQWHRQYGGPTADEVRTKIGRYFGRQPGNEWRLYTAEEIAEAIGLAPERVQQEVMTLIGAHLLERGHVREPGFGLLHLSEPTGVIWAAGGARPIGDQLSPSVSVSVSVHVEVRNLLQETKSANVPAELYDQFEVRLRRVEDELSKPDGDFGKVKDLVETANHSRELLVPTIQFLAKHAEKLQQLADTVQGLI